MVPTTIHFRGRTYPVLERLHFGRRNYLVVKSLSGGLRERYQTIEPVADDFRAILVLPRSERNTRHLKNLKRLANRKSSSFPQIFEFHPRGDIVFVIQDWAPGLDLARKLEHAERYPDSWPHPAECFQIYRRLAHALTQVHRRTGLIHGDIRPSNFVLDGLRVSLIDFGNAWTLEQTAHRPPGEGLSGPYSSPEQHRGDAFIECSSDYFSASVIGYQLLTRQLPFDGLGGKAGLSSNGTSMLIPASRVTPVRPLMRDEFWHSIDRTLGKALDLTAKNRFPNSSSWLDEIESIDHMLKHQSKISPRNEKLLKAINWFANWFRKT